MGCLCGVPEKDAGDAHMPKAWRPPRQGRRDTDRGLESLEGDKRALQMPTPEPEEPDSGPEEGGEEGPLFDPPDAGWSLAEGMVVEEDNPLCVRVDAKNKLRAFTCKWGRSTFLRPGLTMQARFSVDGARRKLDARYAVGFVSQRSFQHEAYFTDQRCRGVWYTCDGALNAKVKFETAKFGDVGPFEPKWGLTVVLEVKEGRQVRVRVIPDDKDPMYSGETFDSVHRVDEKAWPQGPVVPFAILNRKNDTIELE
eukprot:Hpha_TRINITY_DN36657_c0_g1::TRINITY_DN36657_c0_g1_i1::g.18725::m.18725